MAKKTFLRRNANRHLKLGKKRKKKQGWRKPKGRDNKMREKRKGYPAVVKIGYKKTQKLEPILINNLSELKTCGEKDIFILGRVGKKKKLEIARYAQGKKLAFQNFNVNKFLKENIKKINKESKKQGEKK